jgi:hypothetical protein
VAFALKTITLNHDLNSAANSAMNIRRNKDFEVPIPEYDSAIPRTPAESCAAYCIAETTAQSVFIRANFTISAPANETYEVQAVGGGVLGNLDTVQVVFSGGVSSVTVNMSLAHRNFSAVGRHDITWQWQYRLLGSNNWLNLAATSHRIYIVLKVPPAPWTQTAADKRNPWTDLLDVCCVKAAGAQTEAAAATYIIKSVNQDYSLRYDIVNGAHRYEFRNTGNSFNLTNWIDYVLRGNAPAQPLFCAGTAEEYKHFMIVNCYDCAASSALMAKILGASSDYYFHGPFGYLRYVIPIGRGKCNNPFYGCMSGNPEVGPDDARTYFGNHAYTKLGGANTYDACMKRWLAWWIRLIIVVIWIFRWIPPFKIVFIKVFLWGSPWLIDLTQPQYESYTIDTSAAFEAAVAAGAPVLQTLSFKIV